MVGLPTGSGDETYVSGDAGRRAPPRFPFSTKGPSNELTPLSNAQPTQPETRDDDGDA